MNEALTGTATATVRRFCRWLEGYGELSYDFQSCYAGRLGRAAKALYYRKPRLGTLAVAPMVACEALLPQARQLFWKPQRFPIADAHYAMGFAFLWANGGADADYERAVHFLSVLEATRCLGYADYCWGYPFNWVTRTGTIREGTPLITTIPYVYEAFSQIYALKKDPAWLSIMRSIAEHVLIAYREVETGPDTASCAYTPEPDAPVGVINASAYRAYLLTKAGTDLGEQRFFEAAHRNLNYVLASQNSDGSWYYADDGVRDFVDHFHTCFVLKALAKIEALTGCARCHRAIARGVGYYIRNLFDARGLPLPFSKRPRLTVYRRELYDMAECINLALVLDGRFPELDRILDRVLTELLGRWQKDDGSFRTRRLFFGWDDVAMHRWGQSQIFRVLCFYLSRRAVAEKAQRALLQPQTEAP
jgi:hypothetical protein